MRFLGGILVSLYIIEGNAAIFAQYRSKCSELILQQAFMKPLRYAKKLHREVEPATEKDLDFFDWPFKSQRSLDAVASQFSYQVEGQPEVKIKMEALRNIKDEKPSLTLLVTFFEGERPNEPVGFVARTFKKNRKGKLIAKGAGFYLDPESTAVRGISSKAREFIDEKVYRKMGVVQEAFLADYLGRYVWAKAGFRFNTSMYYWNGERFESETLKPVVLARQNLYRFLRQHGIKVSELVLRLPGEPQQVIRRLSELASPAHFAYLFHQAGRQVAVTPMIAEGTLGETEEMPVGKAFMLADFSPEPGKPYISSPMGTRFSRFAMPKWHAIRDIEY